VTSDLANFWKEQYTAVKKEMKGRYPKHYWPDDPLQAEATRLTKKQMALQEQQQGAHKSSSSSSSAGAAAAQTTAKRKRR
jgi:ATP-dependent helicase HrpB